MSVRDSVGCVWLSSAVRSCAFWDENNKDNVCTPTIPSGISRLPPSLRPSRIYPESRAYETCNILDAFFSFSGAKLFDPDSGTREGIGCEVGELESWISDNGASRHMTSSHDSMTSYRKCSGTLRIAGGDLLPIEGIGDILLRFLSDSEAFGIQLLNVAFGPQMSRNLLPL